MRRKRKERKNAKKDKRKERRMDIEAEAPLDIKQMFDDKNSSVEL